MGSKCLFSVLKKSCPNLRSIDISGLTATSEGIMFLAHNYGQLAEFSMGSCIGDCEPALSQLFTNTPSLKSLKLRGIKITGECFVNLVAGPLEEIVFDNLYVTSPVPLCNVSLLNLAITKLPIFFGLNINSIRNEKLRGLCATRCSQLSGCMKSVDSVKNTVSFHFFFTLNTHGTSIWRVDNICICSIYTE